MFPNRWGNRIKDTFLSQMLKHLEIAAVPHGFRSSFRDWAAEETDHPREVIEAALAHVVRNRVEAAYARSDLFERRRRLHGRLGGLRPAGASRGVHDAAGPKRPMTGISIYVSLDVEAPTADVESGPYPAIAQPSSGTDADDTGSERTHECRDEQRSHLALTCPSG